MPRGGMGKRTILVMRFKLLLEGMRRLFDRQKGCLPRGSTERADRTSPGKALQCRAKCLGTVTRIRAKN